MRWLCISQDSHLCRARLGTSPCGVTGEGCAQGIHQLSLRGGCRIPCETKCVRVNFICMLLSSNPAIHTPVGPVLMFINPFWLEDGASAVLVVLLMLQGDVVRHLWSHCLTEMVLHVALDYFKIMVLFICSCFHIFPLTCFLFKCINKR